MNDPDPSYEHYNPNFLEYEVRGFIDKINMLNGHSKEMLLQAKRKAGAWYIIVIFNWLVDGRGSYSGKSCGCWRWSSRQNMSTHQVSPIISSAIRKTSSLPNTCRQYLITTLQQWRSMARWSIWDCGIQQDNRNTIDWDLSPIQTQMSSSSFSQL